MLPRALRAVGVSGALLLAALLIATTACEPQLVVGEYSLECESAELVGAQAGAGGERSFRRPSPTEPLPGTWGTGFENGFCDYAAASGYCFVAPNAGYATVTSPVRSGRYAAAYTLATDNALTGNQSRCALGGQLPAEGRYGAYFFIPESPTAAANWNLIHFRGFDDGGSHGLWDVSLILQDDGSLRVYVFDHLRMLVRNATRVPAVPVRAWFKLEVSLKRASDDSGSFTLYQDDQVALELTDLTTDDSTYGEWYLGNLAGSLTPSDATLYVDDVFLREAP